MRGLRALGQGRPRGPPQARGHQRREGGPRRGCPRPRALDVDHRVGLAAGQQGVAEGRAGGQRVPGTISFFQLLNFWFKLTMFLSEDL